MRARVLVLGGTNFIGRNVVRELHRHGCAIAVFHRGNREAEDEPPGVEHFHGDRANVDDFRPQFTGFNPDVVVDMRAMVEADALAVSRSLTGAARRAVLVSSMDVYRAYDVLRGKDQRGLQNVPFSETAELRPDLYPYRGETLRDESDPAKWMDDYDKIPVERIFLANETMPATVLRLPAVYGPWDRQTRFLSVSKRMVDDRHVIVLDRVLAGWRFMHGFVGDIAHAIALAALNEKAAGKVYNVGEPQTPTTADRIRDVAAVVGWELRMVLRDGNDNEAGYNLAQDMVGDTSKIRRELGYSEQTPRAEGIRQTIGWERAHLPSEFDTSAFDYASEDAYLRRTPHS